MGIEGPSLVHLLDQLETAGLVLRREDPSDRRAKVLNLTPAGAAVVARIEAEFDRLRESAFAGIAAADLEAGMRMFEALQDHVRGGPEAEEAGG